MGFPPYTPNRGPLAKERQIRHPGPAQAERAAQEQASQEQAIQELATDQDQAKAKLRDSIMQKAVLPRERRIRLEPRSITDTSIPWHPTFATVNDSDLFGDPAAHISPDRYLTETLSQAHEFISHLAKTTSGANNQQQITIDSKNTENDRGIDVNPKSDEPEGWIPLKSKPKPGEIEVNLFCRRLTSDGFFNDINRAGSPLSDNVPGGNVKNKSGQDKARKEVEYWSARSSKHPNSESDGTASAAEFYSGLKRNHSENEAAFTPTIKWCNKVLEWTVSDLTLYAEGGVQFTDVSFGLYEMYHSLPAMVKNRIFPFLLISAKVTETEFIVVSLPVSDSKMLPLSKIPGSKAIIGRYVAVERVRVVESEVEKDGMIEWIMATASDAEGWLPMKLQKSKVPGEIKKDVGYFLEWTAAKRDGGNACVENGGSKKETALEKTARKEAAKGNASRKPHVPLAFRGRTPGDGAGG